MVSTVKLYVSDFQSVNPAIKNSLFSYITGLTCEVHQTMAGFPSHLDSSEYLCFSPQTHTTYLMWSLARISRYSYYEFWPHVVLRSSVNQDEARCSGALKREIVHFFWRGLGFRTLNFFIWSIFYKLLTCFILGLSQCCRLRFGGHWSSPNLKFFKLREIQQYKIVVHHVTTTWSK